MYRVVLLFSVILFSVSITKGQLLISDPAFPTADDEITITYNANLGNGNLAGVIPVYTHTGVITNLSETPTSWRHVVGNWGTADGDVIMTPLGGNLHQFTLTPSEYYDLEDGEVIERLAFVFRNVNGSLEGKDYDGTDIFMDLYDGGFASGFFLPEFESQLINSGESIDFLVQASQASTIHLEINGQSVATEEDATSLEYTVTGEDVGEFEVVYTADNGMELQSDTINYIVQPPVTLENPPLGTEDGINYLNGSTVILQLFAPGKEYVYVMGDFNDWQYDLDFQMKKSLDGNRFWLMINGLSPGEPYRFQYWIDDEAMRIADPYSELILDFWNDPFIPEESFPDLLEYPDGLTTEPVGVLQTNQQPFSWTDQSYERPEKEKLIVYELLIRDFLDMPNYQTLIDTLDYLDNLGVNAIQLMPVNEFEGNISWGYNPSFFFAPDKYYGTPDDYKTFVDECHNRGIAVIMDIALNHSFGQNPQVRMWFDPNDGEFGSPTPENPFFNEDARHDFNVGYDYNHESPHTRIFSKRVLEHWVREYHIDGYRLDLSKGFTQNNTLGSIAAWNAYDQSRIDILNDYANHLWDIDEDIYVILEHFANNDEETALSNLGMMLWGNMHGQYSEAAMGYSSDLSGASYQARGWSDPHLVSYAESHDEERTVYSCLNFGNGNGDYTTTDLSTALSRKELIHALLIPLPGPKMLWQFGELGYDYSINYCPGSGTISPNCRTDPKPIRWDYFEMEDRLKVYKVYSALHALKNDYPTFSTTDYNIDFGGMGKRIQLNHPEMNAVVIGNTDVVGINMVPGFQQTGTWYEYFSGDVIEENNLENAFFLEPGEYRIYTDEPLPTPDLSTSIDEVMEFFNVEFIAQPNPFENSVELYLSLSQQGSLDLIISDMSGRVVKSMNDVQLASGDQMIRWDGRDDFGNELNAGLYIVTAKAGAQVLTTKLIKQ